METKSSSFFQYDLSIILPRYREGIEEIVSTLDKFGCIRDRLSAELIIVDDGGSSNIFPEIRKHLSGVKIIRNKKNSGKGFSIREGVKKAQGQIIFYSDIDLPVSLESIFEGYALMRSGTQPRFLIGTRTGTAFRGDDKKTRYRKFTSRFFLRAFNFLLEPQIKDSQCPCKFFSAEFAKQIFSKNSLNGYAFDAELIHMARLMGIEISQFDVIWSDTRASWGKFKTARVFLRMLADLLRIRLYWIIMRRRLKQPSKVIRQKLVRHLDPSIHESLVEAKSSSCEDSEPISAAQTCDVSESRRSSEPRITGRIF